MWKPIDETNYGLYVWITDDGKVVCDEERNYLCITAKKGDLVAVRKLKAAAREFGVETGKAFFLAGSRMVDDEEYERQKARLALGLIPDEYDGPAYLEELKNRGQR